MRIHPPKVTINPEDPFKEALFGRRAFAESLNALLRNVSEGLVILVHAPWGDGKTTFAKMWQADLARHNCNAIYFDAYAADYFADPFVCFSGEILHFTEKKLPDHKGVMERQEFKNTAFEVAKRLAGLATRITLKSATLGAFEEAHIKDLKEILSDLASGVSKIGADAIEKHIEHYTAEKDSLATFKMKLAKLAAVVREQQGFPLTIIVDELDRCRPDFALSLLERIKHLFEVEGVAFVLLVNRDQIESYIKTIYGEVDARAYLLKFANLFVDLPRNRLAAPDQYEKARDEYCRLLWPHYELGKSVDPRTLARSLEDLTEHFSITLREIEKVFAVLALYYSSLPTTVYTNQFIEPVLAILKVTRPTFYAELRAGRVSVKNFFEETRLDHLNTTSFNPEWSKKLLSICLMSDEEYQAALNAEKQTNEDPISFREVRASLRIGPSRVIPIICSRLDRFSLKP